jgi:hypothetical protein
VAGREATGILSESAAAREVPNALSYIAPCWLHWG